MTIEIRVPALGESVTEATVAKWFKQVGEAVAADEPLCELETDKVTVEVPASAAGVLADIAVESGATVEIGALLGHITEGAVAVKPKAAAPAPAKPAAPPAAKPTVAAPTAAASAMPAARKLAEEKGVDTAAI